MRLPKLFQTLTFKLALVQTGLFAASAAILFGTVYWSMVGYARTQLRSAVEVEAETLAETRSTDGLADLVSALEARTRERASGGFVYLLRSADGVKLAGSLEPKIESLGWQDLAQSAATHGTTDDEPHELEVLGRRLPTGELLMVGRDTRDLNDVEEHLIQSFGLAAGLTLCLAILSGVVTSLGALRRVEAMAGITRRIMEGDLAKRVPERGTGDEFDRLATNLNAMLDRIQHLMEGLRQVSSDIAHDLRTPLTHLRQRLELAQDSIRTVDGYEALVASAIEDTDHILKMFAALLRIAQIEAGTRRSGFAAVDVSTVANAILDTYGAVAEDNGQILGGVIAPGVEVNGDRELLLQMLANLVENAIRYAGPGARIELTLEEDAGGARAIVADTGPGIEAGLHDKVFRRFFKAETHRGSDGHGLGLSLVRAVADLHGIAIEMSDARPGLKVELRLPTDGRTYNLVRRAEIGEIGNRR